MRTVGQQALSIGGIFRRAKTQSLTHKVESQIPGTRQHLQPLLPMHGVSARRKDSLGYQFDRAKLSFLLIAQATSTILEYHLCQAA